LPSYPGVGTMAPGAGDNREALDLISIPTTLKIGVMWHDRVAQPQPPVIRCLYKAVLVIQEAGHIVLP
jgi:hypothetical protein